jgi:hypothetical protein
MDNQQGVALQSGNWTLPTNFHIKSERVMKDACYVEFIGKMINALNI